MRVTVDAITATGALAAPQWVGRPASLAYTAGLVAIIARDPAAIAVWNEWAASAGSPASAQLIAGPYAITGTVLTPDGTLQGLLSDRIAVHNATVVRLDRSQAAPISMPCGMVSTRSIQAGVLL